MATRLRLKPAQRGRRHQTDRGPARARALEPRAACARPFPRRIGSCSSPATIRMLRLEGAFLEALRAEVARGGARRARGCGRLRRWFEALEATGPGQGDPLFPWLAEQAALDEMRWFLEQEAAGEAGFDDLVALTQVKLPTARQARARPQLLGRDGPRQRQGHARADARRAGRAARARARDRRHGLARASRSPTR